MDTSSHCTVASCWCANGRLLVSEWAELLLLLVVVLVVAGLLSMRRRYSHVKPPRKSDAASAVHESQDKSRQDSSL
jgi:hypothetical protein